MGSSPGQRPGSDPSEAAGLARAVSGLEDRLGAFGALRAQRRTWALRLLVTGQSLATLLLLTAAALVQTEVEEPGVEPPEPAVPLAEVLEPAPDVSLGAPPPRDTPGCDIGRACWPIPVEGPVFRTEGDTRLSPERAVSRYACSPVEEGGAEVWYAVEVERPGMLVASIEEVPDDGVDIDVHLLSAAEPSACVARGDALARAEVRPGTYYVVVDTCSLGGVERPGPYRLTVRLP